MNIEQKGYQNYGIHGRGSASSGGGNSSAPSFVAPVNNMDEAKIRQIVQQEIAKQNNKSRFGIQSIPNHKHDGVDSLQIKQDNIIPSVSVSGRITFAQETDYTVNLNSSFTPSFVNLYGIAYDTGASGVRCMIQGTANLGPSFYLQPNTGTSVITGDVQYPFVDPNLGVTVPLQSSSYIWVDNGSTTFHGQPGEGHIVDVQWSGTIYARATITDFSKSAVVFNVSTLASGWEIYANLVIT